MKRRISLTTLKSEIAKYEEANIIDHTEERNVWNLDPNPSAPTTEALVTANDSSDVHNKLDEEANIIDHTEERNVWNLDPNPSAPTTEALVTANDSSDVHNKLDEEANIIDHTEERNVWNLDPNPSAPTTEALVTANDSSDVHNKLDEEANIIDHTEERNVWNLDPNPSAPTTEALVTANDSSDVHNKLDEEANIIDHTEERNVWNLDPNPSAPTTEALVTANDSSDVHNKLDEEANIIDHTEERNVWNLDPNPSAPTTEALVTANDSSDVHNKLDEKTSTIDYTEERNVWNLDPIPSSESRPPSAVIDPACINNDEVEQPVWNLTPHRSSDANKSPELPQGVSDDAEDTHPEFVEDDTGEDDASADSSGLDKPSMDPALVTEPVTVEKSEANTWNLDPNPSSSLPSPEANISVHEDPEDSAQNEDTDSPAGGLSTDGGLDHAAQVESNSHTPGSDEVGQDNTWNLNPSSITTEPIDKPGIMRASDEEGAGELEWIVWNLDPHTGDTSEPNNSVIEMDNVLSASPSTSTKSTASEQGEPSSGSDAPAFSCAGGDFSDPPEHVSNPPSSQNSPRESGAASPAEDDTPDYTPPSTGRDSDAAGDEGDAAW
ncbi:unnamed protein product [Phytophthora fragariaefolia]|uniref:Unnamed protein product n=1 Tax=Phytophthora fragariaefolia TaxID=1490495 RepID=A0A9W6Y515_9STRA|nr:unnamed protein product [Phytophthora fragariaefolia]